MRDVDPPDEAVWGKDVPRLNIFARNVSVDYLTMAVDLGVGLLMLPFNVAYLGQSAYGLWMLTASVTVYFSLLDLGFGHGLMRFVAQCRARRDSYALNQVVSTLIFVFTGIGLATYMIGALLAFNLDYLFKMTAEQATTGKYILLIISAYFALKFPFSVFGGVVNGFQRQYLNGIVYILTSVAVAVVNVAVLLAGYGLVELVAATTAVRILSYGGYRLNAYRVFPGLKIRPRYFRFTLLREVTGFSAFMLLIDLANKLNYSTDAVVIGAFMSTAAVATWVVAQRLIELTQGLTNQVNGALFPVVVDSATLGHTDQLRLILLQGTRLSLAMVIPVATGLALLADPLVMVWVGPEFAASVPVIYILAIAVVVRVGNATATTLLKGSGRHRLLAFSNMSMAIVNLLLSVALVGKLGLIGVALGTLIPLAGVSIIVLFPAACRRVEISPRRAVVAALWPAVWPAALMAAFLVITRNLIGASLASIAFQAVSGGLIYASLFLKFAIKREERQWYLNKAKHLLRPSFAAAA